MTLLTTPFANRVNLILGAISATLSYFLGDLWYLFLFYLALNVLDLISGNIKHYLNHTINSKKGAIGIVKKFGYWIMILVAFEMSAIFMEVGETFDVDLRLTSLVGWFVLLTLIVNEIRSILENLVEAGYKVPKILVKGLEVAKKIIEKESEIGDSLLEDEEEKTEEEKPEETLEEETTDE